MFKRFYTRVQILEETEEYIKLVSPSSHTNRFKFLVGLLLLLALFNGVFWATAPSGGFLLGIGMATSCLFTAFLLWLIQPWRSQVLLDAERRLIQFSPQYLLLARWSRHGKQMIPFSDVTEVNDPSTSELKLSTKDGRTIILRFDKHPLEAALVADRLTTWLYPLLSPSKSITKPYQPINLFVMMQSYTASSDDALLGNPVKKVTSIFSLRTRLALDMGTYKIRLAELKKSQIIDELNVIALQDKNEESLREMVSRLLHKLKAWRRKSSRIMTISGVEPRSSKLIFDQLAMTLEHNSKNKTHLITVGEQIEEPLHKATESQLLWPVREGVIADFLAAKYILAHHQKKILKWRMAEKHFAVSIPFGSTDSERRAMTHIIGLPQNVFLIEDLLAAAVAADLDLMADHAHCVLLIGAGRSSIGIIKLGGIAHGKRLAYGGDWLDLAIQRHLYSTHAQSVSLYSCRQIKHAIGSLSESESDKRWQAEMWDIQGNSLTLPLTAADIKPALEKGLAPLLEELAWFFKTLPEEMLTIQRDGILLAGGTAYLHGLDIWLVNQLDMPVRIAAEPDLLVVRGLKKVLVML